MFKPRRFCAGAVQKQQFDKILYNIIVTESYRMGYSEKRFTHDITHDGIKKNESDYFFAAMGDPIMIFLS